MNLSDKVIDWVEANLLITQGEGAGSPMVMLPWERRFLTGALRGGVDTSALTIARGNGKTTLLAALAAAAVLGPLAQPRGEVVVVASSFSQAKILWNHVRAFLLPWIEANQKDWRVEDSSNRSILTHKPSGITVKAIGSDPKRAHGLAPSLALLDEPAQWLASTSRPMLAAVETSLGKLAGARIIALGTSPATASHWFSEWLTGSCDYKQLHHAGVQDDPFKVVAWKKANPSWKYMPTLQQVIRRAAKRAKENDSQLASFKALRLNLGTSDVLRSLLLTAPQYEAMECHVEDLPEAVGLCVFGIDLGGSAAMSALSAYWPMTGRSQTLAAFPEYPDLLERGRIDHVGDLYQQMHDRGELVLCGARIVDVARLLAMGMERFGNPDSIVADRWREGELRQALDSAQVPPTMLIMRGQGFKDGGADTRDYRKACTDGKVKTPVSLMMRSAVGGAVTVSDPAGNSKLAKASDTPERRDGHRDDAVAAMILAVAIGYRRMQALTDKPQSDYSVI